MLKNLPKGYTPRGPTLSEYYEAANAPRSKRRQRQHVPRATGTADEVPAQYDDARDESSGALPDIVAQRMLRRMLAFAGVPLALGLLCFSAFFVAKYRYDVTVLPTVVGYVTLSAWGAALVGLTYGILSASWDPDYDAADEHGDDDNSGGRLGWRRARTNVARVADGLRRARRRELVQDEIERWDDNRQQRRRQRRRQARARDEAQQREE